MSGIHKFAVGIDPGMRYLGFSLAMDGAILQRRTLCRVAGCQGRDVKATGAFYLQQLLAHLCVPQERMYHLEIALERMVFYPGQSAPVADLLDIQAVGAFVAGALARTVTWYEPAQWKGQLGKKACAAAQERILLAEELPPRQADLSRMVEGIHEHALDAEGILLHHLGRFGPRNRTGSFR